jgi:hypothetical protein
MKCPKTPIELLTIPTTILDRMSNIEHRNLLIFEALATRLFVSAEDRLSNIRYADVFNKTIFFHGTH